MLNHEYTLLNERLDRKKYKDTRFFTFADTVTTINYSKTMQGHGWIGVRFQRKPDEEPSDFIIHIILNDQDARLQMLKTVIGTKFIARMFSSEMTQEKF